MPNTRKLQLSFGGGEIDPEMYSRVDAAQYQSGLAKAQNWMVDPKGPLKKRPGFQRVDNAQSNSRKSRLIPFTYSVDQSLIVELAHEKIKLHSDGSPVNWAESLDFLAEGVNTTTNTITFINDHRLINDDEIVFRSGTTAVLPTGINEGQTYFAIVTGSRELQISEAAATGIVIGLSGSPADGSGGLRAYRRSGLPADYKPRDDNLNVYDNGGASEGYRAWFGNPSGFYQGQKVHLVQVGWTSSLLSTIPELPASLKVPLYVDFDPNIYFTNESFALRTRPEYVGTSIYQSGLGTGTAINTGTTGGGLATYHVPSANVHLYLAAYYEEGDTAFLPYNLGPAVSQAINTLHLARAIVAIKDTLAETQLVSFDPIASATRFVLLPEDGELEITSPYTEDELFEIEYEQSGDIITLTHPNYQPRELRRYSNLDWKLVELSFAPSILPPESPIGVTIDRGISHALAGGGIGSEQGGGINDGLNWIYVNGGVPFTTGDTVYMEINSGSTGISPTAAGFYFVESKDSVELVGGDPAPLPLRSFVRLKQLNGSQVTVDPDASFTGSISYSSSSSDTEQKYKITAVDVNLQESLPSDEIIAEDQVLEVPGASNTLGWLNSANALSYKIYKEQNGVFGFIGSVENNPAGSTSFKDDYIGADMSDTLPLQDDDIAESYQPRTVANFEQRRCFAGSDAFPRTLFMSRSGTQSSFTYQMPVQASDRVSVQIASREAHTIRHLVGLRDLIILTQQGEWQVTAINSDAVGPETIAIRPQSFIGSNKVRPIVVNNKVVFCANRGGHVREFGFEVQNDGYLTGDLSLRASHLFDGYELTDLAYSKAPTPRLWFVSSSGKLLSLTYVPEEKVLAWQQFVTDGTFESVCAIPEGNFDNVYVVVKRTDSTGATVRSIERMEAVQVEEREDAVYLDASSSYNGTNTGARTLEIISSGLYKSGDSVSVKSNEAGIFNTSDVDNEIEFTSGAAKYRLRITAYTSATQVEGTLLADFPSDLHRTAITTWATAAKSVVGYSHLANQSVSVLADGVMHSDVTVSATGTITLEAPAVKICAGLKYTCEAQTLPVSLEMEAGGQGRTKTVNKVYLRVDNSSNLSIGSDSSNLVSVGDLSSTSLTTGEFETQIPDSWDQEGQIVIQSTDALPSTILGLTAQISVGD